MEGKHDTIVMSAEESAKYGKFIKHNAYTEDEEGNCVYYL